MEIFDTLRRLLDEKKYADFILSLDSLHPVDAAEFLTSLPKEKLPVVFRMLKKETAAEIFSELDSDEQELIISTLTDAELTQVTEELFTDDVVDLLEELPANVVKRVLSSVSSATRATVNRFLAYSEGSAGSIMTSEYATLKVGMSVTEAIEHIRKTGYDKETVYYIFVTDSGRHLLGTLELYDLLIGQPDAKIEELMDSSPAYAQTAEPAEEAAAKISKYDLLALPVVDSEKRLVGIITFDDAMDVLEEEATEDIVKMSAATPADRPYLRTGVFEFYLKRIPWLLLLMLSATFTGGIIRHYESALGSYVILTVFIPMLMNTGGNAGGQASATVIRSLSLGGIAPKNILSVLFKEFGVALLCGVTLAAAAFLKALWIDSVEINIALIIALTIFCGVIISKLIGASLPLAARAIGLDPAVTASPILSTIIDALSLIIYFAFASLILGI